MNEDRGHNKWLDLTNGVCWSMIFSLAAIIMSIVALAHTHPRVLYSTNDETVVLGFDYIGVIVGILTLLVTLLVAWNIWQTMATKREVERAYADSYKAKKLANRCSDNIKTLQIQNLGIVKHVQGELEFSSGKYFDACLSFIDAAKEYVTAQNNKELYISTCLSKIEMCLDNAKDDKSIRTDSTTKDLIDRITAFESLINNTNSAQRFIKQTLARIKTKLEGMQNDTLK